MVVVIMLRRCRLLTRCSSSSFTSWVFVGQRTKVTATSSSTFVCLVLVASSLLIAAVLLGSDRSQPDVAYRPEISIESADIGKSTGSEVNDLGDLATSNEQHLNTSVDVIVFLHIQKTGGTTFGRHLVLDLEADSQCVCSPLSTVFRQIVISAVHNDDHHSVSEGQNQNQLTLFPVEAMTSSNERSTNLRQNHRRSKTRGAKNFNRLRCDCRNTEGKTWLFGRESTGWACGLHADWTELNSCVPGTLDRIEGLHRLRRYQYVTLLRDPLLRFLSEWKHVQRGGSAWTAAHLTCNGRPATLNEVPLCFNGSNWSGVTLDDFLSCPYNLAVNRQTRMLADLTRVGCYNTSSMPTQRRLSTILNDAKSNLRRLAFFGLTERQTDTEYLFEQRFGVRFHQLNELQADVKDERPVFQQYNSTRAERAAAQLTADELLRVRQANDLDVQLFEYAKQLFDARLQAVRSSVGRELQ